MKDHTLSSIGNDGNAVSNVVSPAELVAALAKDLPPVFCRADIDKLMCGVITSRTQANLDSAGKGPRRYRQKGKVIYAKADYVPWLTQYLEERWQDNPNLDTVA